MAAIGHGEKQRIHLFHPLVSQWNSFLNAFRKTRHRRGAIHYKQLIFDLADLKFNVTPLFQMFLGWEIDLSDYFQNCVLSSCKNSRWLPSSIIFVSDFSNSVASLLRYYEPDKRLQSSQNGSLFYPRHVITFKHFYSNRVVSIWNSLLKDLRQEQTLTSFVGLRQLNIFYYLKIEDSFNCGNVCTWTNNCGCQACV